MPKTNAAAKPAAAKTPAKPAPKTAPKTAPAKETAAPAKETGIRKPQVRILLALAKHPEGLTRKEISEKAPCDSAWLTSWVGSTNDEVRLANDEKEFPSLITLGFVKVTEDETRGRIVTITPAGKKAAAK